MYVIIASHKLDMQRKRMQEQSSNISNKYYSETLLSVKQFHWTALHAVNESGLRQPRACRELNIFIVFIFTEVRVGLSVNHTEYSHRSMTDYTANRTEEWRHFTLQVS